MKSRLKKRPIVITCATIIVLLSIGLSAYRYATGIADGYWVQESHQEYNYLLDKWNKKEAMSKDELLVINHNRMSRYTYEKKLDEYPEKFQYKADSPLPDTYKIKPFSHTISNNYTTKEYVNQLKSYYQMKNHYDEDSKADIEVLTLKYSDSVAFTIKYRIKGDKLYTYYYGKSGQVAIINTYKKIQPKNISLSSYLYYEM